MEKQARMRELISILKDAAKAYYQEAREIMSNWEYDKLYDELVALEQETGVVLAGSPTVSVGYEAVTSLPKERHETPMLSLDKTKDPAALAAWLGEQEGLLSWKMDGLTIVLTYREGKLYKAVTRGNGEMGEVITGNARAFQNLPHQIPYQEEVILRGEAVIRYSDFERINDHLPVGELPYKNPRNLCSGSVRQLNNAVTAERMVYFYAFSLVKGPVFRFQREAFSWLASQGFEVVEYTPVRRETVEEAVQDFAARIPQRDIPSDGLVLTFDDIAYGQSLGRTAKFPRHSIAFKWQDELRETRLLQIEWSASRTGLINPIAVFEPVELEGTTVSRASLHNVSICEELELGIGDTITVYKANMIIPQVAENLTRSGQLSIPKQCPVCGEETRLQEENGVKSLLCPNPDCLAKKIKSLALFVSRDAMNIEGLSEATLEKFVEKGFLHELADLFDLSRHRDEIKEMEGFGEKSVENLLSSIETAQNTTQERLLYSLGIPGIGLSGARLISQAFHHDFEAMMRATEDELLQIDGIGPVLAAAYTDYFAQEKNQKIVVDLLKKVHFLPREEEGEKPFTGMTFVITGTLHHFTNRKELQEELLALGAKVAGSVSSKTTYLINNDAASSSSKNRRARELGIPILTEEELLARFPGREE